MNLGLLKKSTETRKVIAQLSLETRHEHSISVPDSTSLNHCVTDKTLQHNFFILLSNLIRSDLSSILLEPKIHYQKGNTFIIYS